MFPYRSAQLVGSVNTYPVYDGPLEVDRILVQLARQPTAFAQLTTDLPRARLRRSQGRGEWSINDVLAHLRSCGDVWGTDIAAIVAEDRPTIRAVNPTTWIKSTNYPELEFAPSLRAFARQRAVLLTLLRALPTAGWSRTAIVTGAGTPRERSVLDYARRLADHERSHVKHIARLAKVSSGTPRIRSRPGTRGP